MPWAGYKSSRMTTNTAKLAMLSTKFVGTLVAVNVSLESLTNLLTFNWPLGELVVGRLILSTERSANAEVHQCRLGRETDAGRWS